MKRNLLATAASLALGAILIAGCSQKEDANGAEADAAAEEGATGEASDGAETGEGDDATASEDGSEDGQDASPAAEPDPEVEAMKSENLAKSTAFLEENGTRDGVVTLASGLQYEVLSEGEGEGLSPAASDLVTVHYVGTLTDGTEFDSSRKRDAAARFPLNAVIPGWTEGVQLMSEGDRFRLYLPPELAYGEGGTPGGPIGPNEALIFDVELLKVSNPEINLAKSKEFLAENGKKDGIKTTESGLQYQVLTEGDADGKSPSDANVVKVHYEGKLVSGEIFDSSLARGEPAEFPLARVIAGWTEGVQLMSEGDKFRFFVPPELGYGERGTPTGSIGPNEALIFDVELIEVKE
ncbi:MAG: FKBP-type peptidyl-prolyl cis-trans isomerase [Pseudomonadota bacterium]